MQRCDHRSHVPTPAYSAPRLNADLIFSTVTSLLSFGFAVLVGRRCLERRQPALLIWTVGLLWYGLSTGAQAFGALRGWDPLTYRWWYLAGACYTAAYLGMGSIYLLVPRFVASSILAFLLLGSVMVAPLVLLVPIDVSLLPAAGEAPTGQAYSTTVRVVTPVFNVFGAGALFLGAAWGALNFWRHGRTERALANLLIAAGAIVPSFASGLTRFGLTATLALGQLLGLLFILAGFLIALRAGRTGAPRRAPGPEAGEQALLEPAV